MSKGENTNYMKKKTFLIVLIVLVVVIVSAGLIIKSGFSEKTLSDEDRLNIDANKTLEKQGEITVDDLKEIFDQTGSFEE